MKMFTFPILLTLAPTFLFAAEDSKVDLKSQIKEFAAEASFLQFTARQRLDAAKKDKAEASAACFELGVFSSTFTTADQLLKADGKSLERILSGNLRQSFGMKPGESPIAWSEGLLQIACDKVAKGENPDVDFKKVNDLGDVVFPTLQKAYGGGK